MPQAAQGKKLSMQEQMLADAMAQAGVDETKLKPVAATVESKTGKKISYGGSLEGKQQGGGALDEVKKIVRKPYRAEEEATVFTPTTDTVDTTATRSIEELD